MTSQSAEAPVRAAQPGVWDLPARIARPLAIAALPTVVASVWANISFGARCRELECLGVVVFWAALAGSVVALSTGLLLFKKRGGTRAGRVARGAFVALGALGLALAWLALVTESEHWM